MSANFAPANDDAKKNPPEANAGAAQETLEDHSTEGCKVASTGDSADKEISSTQAGAFHMIGDQIVEEEEEGGLLDNDYGEDSERTPPIIEARLVEDELTFAEVATKPRDIESAPDRYTSSEAQFQDCAGKGSPVASEPTLHRTNDFDIEHVILDERTQPQTPIVRA